MDTATFVPTSDKIIRSALIENLEKITKGDPEAKIIEEMGVTNGAARGDIAVVNGTIHGYELKSDADTLNRLPFQMEAYNSVFDQVTLVVGKKHLHQAVKIAPDWWGIMIAKTADHDGAVAFCNIREPGQNPDQDRVALAGLLWRGEALSVLEARGFAQGVRSKTRKIIYKRLAEKLDTETLKAEVRKHLCTRTGWKS